MHIDLDLSAAVLGFAASLGPNGGLYRRNDLLISLRQRGFKVTIPKLNAALDVLINRHKLVSISKNGKTCWMKAEFSEISQGFDEKRQRESRERRLRENVAVMDSPTRLLMRKVALGMKSFDDLPLSKRTCLQNIQKRARTGITDTYLFSRFVLDVFTLCYRYTEYLEDGMLIRYEKIIAEIQKNWGKELAKMTMEFIACWAFLNRPNPPSGSSNGTEAESVG